MPRLLSVGLAILFTPAVGLLILYVYLKKKPCIFCKIINKQIPAKIIAETDSVICVEDVAPAGKYHFLIIPKKHIADVNSLSGSDAQLVKDMSAVGRKVLEQNLDKNMNFKMGFSIPPFLSVYHPS
mmetsp:Transcript_12788/g.17640  ORF Transcript_12788/g.17640 Transcript_12788/m.17640 type:complete len:126 (+) Transcript_12788:34-411(+)